MLDFTARLAANSPKVNKRTTSFVTHVLACSLASEGTYALEPRLDLLPSSWQAMDLEPGTRIADDLPHTGFHGGDLIPLWHNCFTLLSGAQWPLTVRRPSGTGLLTADCSANLTATSCTKLIRQKIVGPVRHQEGIVRDSAGSMASRMTFRNPYTMLSCLHVDAPPCSGRYWLAMRFSSRQPGNRGEMPAPLPSRASTAWHA